MHRCAEGENAEQKQRARKTSQGVGRPQAPPLSADLWGPTDSIYFYWCIPPALGHACLQARDQEFLKGRDSIFIYLWIPLILHK